MHWWCTQCQWFIAMFDPLHGSCVERHRDKVVGIREDIFKEHVIKMVSEERRLGRLEKLP